MKATAPPAKRRRGPRLAVLALVSSSLFVPIAFLFNRFPAVYVTDERPQQEINLPSFDRLGVDRGGSVNEVRQEGGGSSGVNAEAQDALEKISRGSIDSHHQTDTGPSRVSTKLKVLPPPKVEPPKPNVKPVPVPIQHPKDVSRNSRMRRSKVKSVDEVEKAEACQLEFGSYCLWSIEHKEVMKDAIVKRLKDQLFVARSYYPSIAKFKGKEALTRELKQNIQEHERVLSESIVDADLPSFIKNKIEKMDQAIARAKSCTVDCNNVDRKLRQILHMTEDEAHFHMKQSAYLYNLGVHTMPKSHHCLNMRLTVEYFKSTPLDSDAAPIHKFNIPDHRHYVILSKNVLAASVVVNSTVSSSEETENVVFHVLTDAQNFYAMKHWFARNSYRESAVHVINYEHIILENLPEFVPQQLYLPEEFRVFISSLERPTEKTRMKYLSVFSHSHFFIPEIFKDLKKVIVLEDDVVVQRDLSFLWNLDMGDKVNGAVKFCGLRLCQLRNLLGKVTYDPQSCAWMSGVNVINLDKWREYNVTENYLQLFEKFRKNDDDASLRAAALPVSLLSFQHLTYPLDERLTLSGLGYDYAIGEEDAQTSASLHYNGNMKPWLELGIPDYRKYWKRFLTRDEQFMDECNVLGIWRTTQKKVAHMINQVLSVRRKFEQFEISLVPRSQVSYVQKLARDSIDAQIAKSLSVNAIKERRETCTICLEDTDISKIHSVEGCMHRFCFSCMREHVKVKLLHGMLPACPQDGCTTKLSVEGSKIFLSSRLLEIMVQRIREGQIPPTQKIYCPYPKCSALMSLCEVIHPMQESSSKYTVADAATLRKCVKCRGSFCISCKVPWHDRMTCYEYKGKYPHGRPEDAKLQNLARHQLWRQCVKCMHMIELAEGCYHMTCVCGYEFCYTCGKEWKDKKATCSCPLWDERNIIRDDREDNGDDDFYEEDDDYYDEDSDDDVYYAGEWGDPYNRVYWHYDDGGARQHDHVYRYNN